MTIGYGRVSQCHTTGILGQLILFCGVCVVGLGGGLSCVLQFI